MYFCTIFNMQVVGEYFQERKNVQTFIHTILFTMPSFLVLFVQLSNLGCLWRLANIIKTTPKKVEKYKYKIVPATGRDNLAHIHAPTVMLNIFTEGILIISLINKTRCRNIKS